MTDRPGGGVLAAPPPPHGGNRGGRRLTAFAAARLAAIAFLAAGVGFLCYTGYRIWDPGARASERQAAGELHEEWSEHPSSSASPITLETGVAFATIRIPAFGSSWEFPIREGTSLEQLADGPGHVPGTALPGVPGNFAVAAHDITAGNPFLHLGSLRPGDSVIVQDADGTYQYDVTSETVVHYTDTAVIAPVPDHPGVKATGQYITLITCTPVTLAFTQWRIIVTGKLVQATTS